MTKYEYFERLPRPFLRWLCLGVVAWATIAELDVVTRGLLLTFVLSVYGIRGWEKLRGT